MGVFFIIVGGNFEIAPYTRERDAAHRAIRAAILEFELVSGVRIPHYDLELLDEGRGFVKLENEDGLDGRSAELIVNVMESLVERIEMLDDKEPI